MLIGSDGPRVMPEVPTIATGTRGTFHFDLVVDLRPGGVHSGHWGELTTDPAVMLTHALGTIIDRRGKILVRDWLPRNGLPASVRSVLAGCEVGGGGEAASIDPGWGEPGLTAAEKIYGWNSFIVLAMVSGRPENPVNAVAPNAARIARSATRRTPTRARSTPRCAYQPRRRPSPPIPHCISPPFPASCPRPSHPARERAESPPPPKAQPAPGNAQASGTAPG